MDKLTERIINMLASKDREMNTLGVIAAFEQSEEWRLKNLPYSDMSHNKIYHGQNLTECIQYIKGDYSILYGADFIHYKPTTLFRQGYIKVQL